jgi:hypothetical protein
MGELDNVLPPEVKARATMSGSELVLPYSEVLSAITVANLHLIAVLGIESFQIRHDSSLATVSYTGYDSETPFGGDWNGYVTAMNAKAERWIGENRLGENHGYILTSASESEFREMRLHSDKSK